MSPLCKFLLLAPALMLASTVQAKPAKKSSPKLPASVAAMMPSQILDIATYQIAPAPGAPKMLIHLWGAPRRNPDAGGTFHAPAGTFKGKVTVEEVNSFDSLYLTAFTYDIFAPNGKGGWNYLSSIVHVDNSAPYPPLIRYLNNKTKIGLVMELRQFGGQYAHPTTLYVLPTLERGSGTLSRDFTTVSAPANSGSVWRGIVRDVRGYAQLVKGASVWDDATKKPVETRTISTWNEELNDWKDGPTLVVAKK